ncbi:hypothetical protein [Endozoicomonas sp. Mp262]|uniref:hypothetical protein n=1 Tax=Endozoicomonas sp. Mp262 TaxID=2919499 RepID=UPI0021D7E68A
MSNFDIAIGVGEASLNSAIAALYANPSAKSSYFEGSYSKDISGKGAVKLTYDVKAAPTVTLTPPDQASWDKAIKKNKDASLPQDNCFQIHFPDISGSESIDNGSPVDAEGQLTVYLTAAMTRGVLSLDPQAVSIDTSSFSQFDQWFVTSILVPAALDMAESVLGTIKLPDLPSYQGITFNDPGITILSNQLVTAATLSTNKTALSFEGFSTPDKAYYALVSPDTINAVAAAGTASYINKPLSGSDKKGNDMAWAKGSYKASLSSITTTADTTDPTKIAVAVKADISVSGSAGGIGPAMACPIGAALNAF